MPRELDTSRLQKFAPKPRSKPTLETEPQNQTTKKAQPKSVQPWPSREPSLDGQFTVRAPLDVIERFKKMCKDDRRTYADMLGILMDNFEK